MRILLSAYSCEPDRGSEPGVGWNTAIELGRDHDVWVVTKSRHRAAIERELARRPQERVRFIYYDVPRGLRWSGRQGPLVQLHYYLWQYGVYPLARRLTQEVEFDLACHATFCRYWSPSLFALLPIPFVWGGIGGGETVSRAMRATLRPTHRIVEGLKTVAFGCYRFDPFVRLTARRAALVLATSPIAARKIAALRPRRLAHLETTAVDAATIATLDSIEEGAPRRPGDPVCFATLSRLLPWKGVHVGLQALKRLGNPQARYLVVGGGPERPSLERLATRLGIADQVEFRDDAPRDEWMRILKRCHAVVHPSLANTLNTIVLEAMVAARPVIGFQTEYAEEWLGADTSFLVDGSTPEKAVTGLADAMRHVCDEPTVAAERGRRAREHALRLLTWDVRRKKLTRYFEEVVTGAPARSGSNEAPPPDGGSESVIHLDRPYANGRDTQEGGDRTLGPRRAAS